MRDLFFIYDFISNDVTMMGLKAGREALCGREKSIETKLNYLLIMHISWYKCLVSQVLLHFLVEVIVT